GGPVQRRGPVRVGPGVLVHPRHRWLHDRGLQDRGARHRDRSPRPPLQDSRSPVDRRAERPLRGARLGHLVERRTLGFYALMIPLFLALGYDRMVVVSVVTVAP